MSELIEHLERLFHRLRTAGLVLGMQEYLLLWDALRAGFGGPDREALRRLCQRLWVNSREEQALFDYHFDTVMASLPEAAMEAIPAAPPVADEEEREPSAPARAEPGAAFAGEEEREEGPIAPPGRRMPLPEDPVAEARMMELLAGRGPEVAGDRFLLQTEYMPMTRRQMKQSWRTLRRMVREGPPVELDVQATVRQVADHGFLLDPVLRPRRINKNQLLLLLDREGSMVPFHAFGRRLQATAVEAGRLAQTGVTYFHNVPSQQATATMSNSAYREHLLYRDPALVEAVTTREALAGFDVSETDVLIFSDGGAARGSWNRERIENTGTFLYQLKQLGVQEIAWLNPMPEKRWSENSAGAIAAFVPMFSMTRRGLQQAINVLRGRGVHDVQFI